jgi:uncharacterized protein
MSPRERFVEDVRCNPVNRAILERWTALALPDGWLVAGCLFQTVWNLRSRAAPEALINDYDLFYFDAGDVSEAGEQRVQARVAVACEDLGAVIEVKNQARVHLWYPDHFGFAYPQLASSCGGIDRFLVTATCVGLRPNASGWDLYAPHGLELLYQGRLLPNPLTNHTALFVEKAQSYQRRWPWLRIEAGWPV